MTDVHETIEIAIDTRGVARITLDRPAQHNALNDVMIRELRDAARRLGDDDKVRVVVLGGRGASFCAGGDIRWFASAREGSREERIAQSSELARMLYELDQLPKPLIGHINGPAYGGGVGMIAVCDVAVGRTDATFALTEVRLGLIPANISPYVVARIGAGNSRAVMLSGERFDAQRAVAMGLLNEAVACDALEHRINAIVDAHLETAPGAVAETKRLIRFVNDHSVEEAMECTAQWLADAWESDEGRTGVECFLARTTPPWRSGR
jgi:methylglutaconyl-CoA hydratase